MYKPFEEWKSGTQDWLLFTLMIVVAATGLIFILVNFKDRLDVVLAAIAFTFMTIIWLISFLANQQGNKHFGFLGFGQHGFQAMLIGAIVGLGIVLINGLSSLFNPPFAVILNTDLLFGIIFTLGYAPFIEANFFRGFFMPSLQNLFENRARINHVVSGILAILIQGIVFGAFHALAFGWSIPNLLIAMLFGLIAGALVYQQKSIGAEYSAHAVNNFFSILHTLGV